MCKKTVVVEAHGAVDQTIENIVSDAVVVTKDTSLCMQKRSRSVSPPLERYSTWQKPWMKRAWAFHFTVTLLVLVYASIHNHGRKYISVESDNAPGQCSRAFVDVLSLSEDDEGALVCCPEGYQRKGLLGICDRTPGYLPFARRLSQFPEAWLIPIFPFLLRGIVEGYRLLESGTLPSVSSSFDYTNPSMTTRRLCLYLCVLLGRGAILYSFFNFLEHFLIPTPDDEAPCWYRDFLKSFQTPCTGRAFDFSDHVVLYYAQLIPVSLSEVMYCLAVPFWKKENKVVPAALVGGMAYLYFITLLGAYKTTAYYHTGTEIFTGYAVSLLIQIPLCRLQCSSKWEDVRSLFFGQPAPAGYSTLVMQDR